MGQEFVVGTMDVAPGAVAVLFARGSAPVVGAQLAGLDRKAVSVVVWREKIDGPDDMALHEAVRRSGFILQPWTDGTLLEAGCLYVVLPHRRVWFDRARLRVGERREFEAFPIDRFLMSMVRAWGCRSIVVAPDLSGGDGQRGLTAVRQAGGAVVSARSTGPARRTSAAALAKVEAPAPARPKRPPAPSFRVGRLFPFNSAVLVQLRAAAAAAVRQVGSRDRLRVWVPACKTGGLVYGVAMLLRDMFAKVSSSPPRLQVFGTDDDEEALAVARAGRYPAQAGLGMDPHLRGQYTFDEGDAIRMAEALRELCVFSTHKLTRNAPFSRMDLIVCHRVFDGLPPSRRDNVSDELCYALREEGALVAVDHRQHFQTDQFELMPEGYLRPRSTRARALLARVQKASNPRSRFAAGGSNAPRRLQPVPKSAASAPQAQNHDVEQASVVDLERLMRAIGVPLLLLDGELGVMYVSAAASHMFELPTADRGLPLQVLAPRLPGGTDLVHAAKRVSRTGSTEEVTVGAGAQSYLVRISSGLRSGSDGVTIVFIDVGAFDASPRVPF